MSEITVDGNVWTTDWPTEPGWYWFYGWRYGSGIGHIPKLHAISVFQGPAVDSAVVRTIDGSFMYKQEAHQGIFTPMEDPMLPAWRDVEEMAHGQEQRD